MTAESKTEVFYGWGRMNSGAESVSLSSRYRSCGGRRVVVLRPTLKRYRCRMNICDCSALVNSPTYNDFRDHGYAEKPCAGPGGVYSPPAGANYQTVVFYPPPEFKPPSLLNSPLPGSPHAPAGSLPRRQRHRHRCLSCYEIWLIIDMMTAPSSRSKLSLYF